MNNLNLLLENNHPTVTLTETELKVLKSLTTDTISRKDLLINVWGFTDSLASKVTYKDTRMVDMTTSRLKKKVASLGVNIVSVRGVGYRIID